MKSLYLIVIILSNVLTANIPPTMLCDGSIIIPAGTWLIGITFFLRDFIQLSVGKRKTYRLIIIAMILSGVCSVCLGDTALISIGSTVAFVFSETVDTEIFSRLKKSILTRIFISGLIGGTFDSAIFILIGLSPLFNGILSWDQVPFAVLGQVLVKSIVQLISMPFLRHFTNDMKGCDHHHFL